jgi:plastocyanin
MRFSTALCFCLWLSALSAFSQAQLRIVDSDGAPVTGAVLFTPGNNTVDSRLENAGNPQYLIDQRNKRFTPFVTAVPPGSLVSFPNSDDIRHHVYSFSEGNAFELKLYRSNDAEPVRFANVGVAALGCNIHDNMQSFVLVTSRQVAGVSDEDGMIHPKDSALAPEVELWHPQLNAQGKSTLFPVDQSTSPPTVTLPIHWKDPQAARSATDLEALLKRFSTDAP